MSRRPVVLLVACASSALAAMVKAATGALVPGSAQAPEADAGPVESPCRRPPAAGRGRDVAGARVGCAGHDHGRRSRPSCRAGAPPLEVLDGRKWVAAATAGPGRRRGRVLFTAPTHGGGCRRRTAWPRPRADLAEVVWRACAPTPGERRSSPTSSLGRSLAAPWDHRVQGYEVPSRRCSKTDPRATRSRAACCPSASSTTPTARPVHLHQQHRRRAVDLLPLNGHVGTQGRFQYKYGVAAARIKFQDGVVSTARSGCRPPFRDWRRDRRHRVVRHRFVRAEQRRLVLRRRDTDQGRGDEDRGRWRCTARTGRRLPRVLGPVDAHGVRLPHRREGGAADVGRGLADRGVPHPQPPGLQLRVTASTSPE